MTKTTAKQYAEAILAECGDSLAKDWPMILDSFWLLLFKNGDVSLWPEIEKSLQALDDQASGLVRAELWSGNPLAAEELERLTAQILADTGQKQVMWQQHVDKQLLGGYIIKYADRVLDMSYDGNLKRLKTYLSN